ncbi:MAG: HAD family hydrolase [Candidatus Sericytochromatia bacterium]|nr:HAD family hydrolase [Candidatus Tanganyikabacteria bacterium]
MLRAPALRPFDHLVCDLDGTLVDSAPGILAAIRETVPEVLPGWDGAVGPDLIGPPIGEMFARLLGPLAPDVLADLVGRFRAAYDTAGYAASRVYEGVPETLAALREAGVACYVLTLKPTAAARRILGLHGLLPFFADTLSPDDPADPFATKADGARLLCRRHGLPARRTALVGDSPDDLAAARACGLAFHAAGYGYGGIRADRTLDRFTDLLEPAGG